ncbi:MAG: hypothetical protein RMJ88_07430 [Thermogemmata sp.]|nr:hypothetical protein [Thermogemmata sp.]
MALPLVTAAGACIGNARRLRLKDGWDVPPLDGPYWWSKTVAAPLRAIIEPPRASIIRPISSTRGPSSSTASTHRRQRLGQRPNCTDVPGWPCQLSQNVVESAELSAAVDAIRQTSHIGLDIEITGLNPTRDKARLVRLKSKPKRQGPSSSRPCSTPCGRCWTRWCVTWKRKYWITWGS